MTLHNDKGPVHQEDIAILNEYASKNRIVKYVKQKQVELKGRQIHNYSWRCQHCVLRVKKKTRHKICKDIVNLNTAINQQYLMNIYRTLHPTKTKYTLFFSDHGPR